MTSTLKAAWDVFVNFPASRSGYQPMIVGLLRPEVYQSWYPSATPWWRMVMSGLFVKAMARTYRGC